MWSVRRWILRVALLGCLMLWVIVVPLSAQSEVSPTEAMLQANQQYEAGQYAEAIVIYEAIVAAGIENNRLYYNLGNAYFKQGNLGRAILNYRQAQRLTPRDADVAANLKTARSQTTDGLEDSEQGLANLVKVAEEWLTLNESAVLALVLWILICYFAALAVVFRRYRRVFGWIVLGLVIFLVVGAGSIANRLYSNWRYPPAVVVAAEVDVTSGPGGADQYLVEFTLHDGTEVYVLENRPGWRRITLPGNLQGWAPAESVEIIPWH